MSATKTKPAAKAKTTKAKKVEPVKETRNQEGHRIQALINAGPHTVQQLADKTGLLLSRCQGYVDYEMKMKRAKYNGKKQVVLVGDPPRRRNLN